MIASLFTRRLFLSCGTLVAFAGTFAQGASAQESENDFAVETLPEGSGKDFAGTWNEVVPFGTNPPKNEEIKRASEILEAAPKNEAPFKIAAYFDGLTGDDERYKGGWPDRWNPVIVDFFRATNTKPTGDVTPWCAAFLNWCLKRSGSSFPENASSGSFRAWGKQVQTPEEGDIVVFQSTDPDEAKLGRGHVGFVMESLADRVLVLGGNQITKKGHHQISKIWFKKNSRLLQFHSFRTVSKAG